MTDRAILFVDGNNWFHALRRNRIGALAELDYAKISLKLTGPRRWVETRYYIGALQQQRDPRAYAEQRRFLSRLEATDPRIKVLRGRLEPRPQSNALAVELCAWLDGNPSGLPADASATLRDGGPARGHYDAAGKSSGRDAGSGLGSPGSRRPV